MPYLTPPRPTISELLVLNIPFITSPYLPYPSLQLLIHTHNSIYTASAFLRGVDIHAPQSAKGSRSRIGRTRPQETWIWPKRRCPTRPHVFILRAHLSTPSGRPCRRAALPKRTQREKRRGERRDGATMRGPRERGRNATLEAAGARWSITPAESAREAATSIISLALRADARTTSPVPACLQSRAVAG